MTSTSASSATLYFTERGVGPPLLLVHGLMITGSMFDSVVDALAARHRVIVPDLRGAGRSRALPAPYSEKQHASDLANLLDHLGVPSATTLGYSHGGAIAQQFALDYPDRCDRLVLACTYAFNRATLREQIEGRIFPLLVTLLGMPRVAKLVAWQGLKQLGKARAAALAQTIADQDAATMMAAWKEAMAFDSRPFLSRIKCPTLIIAASEDAGVPRHHAVMLHAGIPHSQLVTVEGANHALVWTHPDDFVRTVESFLDAQPTQGKLPD